MPMQYAAIKMGCTNDNFLMQKCDIFLVFAQKLDCRYTLEPPHFEADLTRIHNICVE